MLVGTAHLEASSVTNVRTQAPKKPVFLLGVAVGRNLEGIFLHSNALRGSGCQTVCIWSYLRRTRLHGGASAGESEGDDDWKRQH